MFQRLSNSFALARSSWQVLRTDKKLVLFPILSGICCIIVLIAFWAPVLLAQPAFLQGKGNPPAWIYPLAFAFYFVNYFVIVFFNAALVSCALIRFHGGTPTVGDGLRAAFSRLPQILAWALVSATVGMILKVIENAHEKAGEFISAILGTVWTVITYFVVPVLVVEKVGPIEAIKRSVSILKKTWGEKLIGGFGIGLFIFLLALPGILLLVVGGALAFQAPPLGILVMVLAFLYLIGVMAVGSALSGIYLSALYEYAAFGEIPQGYDREAMVGAFAHKS
jgi:hypothetical protein